MRRGGYMRGGFRGRPMFRPRFRRWPIFRPWFRPWYPRRWGCFFPIMGLGALLAMMLFFGGCMRW